MNFLECHFDGGLFLRGSVEMMYATKLRSTKRVIQLAQCKNTTNPSMKLVIWNNVYLSNNWQSEKRRDEPEKYEKCTILNAMENMARQGKHGPCYMDIVVYNADIIELNRRYVI